LNLSIYPGQQVHQAYGGPGYDCAGTAQRPGTLDAIGMLQNPGGLAGLSPSVFRGGGSQLGSGGPVVTTTGKLLNGGKRRNKRQQQQGGLLGVPPSQGSIAGTPSSGTPAQTFRQEGSVGPNVNAATRGQMGGRYGMEMAPANLVLSPSNGVGMSGYAQNGRIMCETGSTNDTLNPNPNGVQSLNTLPNTMGIANMTQIMRGGKRRKARTSRYRKQSQKKKANKQQGGVVVGQADAMRYYAPTAGYENLPLMPQVPNNPGILMQLGYPAGHFNPACMKTN